jgi:hypothetical protein
MQARTAVMAQVRQVMDIRLRKLQTPCHGREYSAEALAVTAGIANGHLSLNFAFIKVEYGNQITRCLGIKQLHVGAPWMKR